MVERAIVARHAESTSNAANVLNGDPSAVVPLTPLGREQARRLGESLGDERLDLVITSEFPRARETADIAAPDVERLVLPALNDPNGGDWEGMDLDAYLAWADAADPDHAPPGGESLRQVFTRVAAALRAIAALPGASALVIGHGLPISVTLAAAEGELDDRAVYPPVPNATPFPLSRSQLEAAAERIERVV